jgi:hypothetical protein
LAPPGAGRGPAGAPVPTPPSGQGLTDLPSIGGGDLPPSATGLLPRIDGGGTGGTGRGGKVPAAQNDVLPGSSGESRMTLVSPAGDLRDARDWAIVLGIVLGAEVVLLGGVGGLSLLRRHLAAASPGAPSRRRTGAPRRRVPRGS